MPHAAKISPGPMAVASSQERKMILRHVPICRRCAVSLAEDSEDGTVGGFYGVPTNVVTLWALSVTVTRDCETVTAEPWPRLWLAEVS